MYLYKVGTQSSVRCPYVSGVLKRSSTVAVFSYTHSAHLCLRCFCVFTHIYIYSFKLAIQYLHIVERNLQGFFLLGFGLPPPPPDMLRILFTCKSIQTFIKILMTQ